MSDYGKPKYYTLMEQLKEQILNGEISPGEKLPSENELSARYRISRHTVRKALAILENEGCVEAVHGKGTFCSEGMRHGKNSKNIAVITTYISDYIFPEVIRGIDEVLSRNGYSIILKNTGNSRQKEAEHLRDLLEKDIDGCIVEPSKSQLLCRNMDLYQKLDQFGIPYVFIQGLYEQMKEKPHILMDDCQGGYLVTKHLLELGHRRILGVFKADDSQGKERHKGYVKALQEAGILYDPDLVIWFHTEDRRTKPAAGVKMLLEQGTMADGVVCYNDQTAVQVISMLKENGYRIPEDMSVTGYDNSLYARHGEVGLTTIAHPQEKLGEMAAELLLEKIRGVSEEESRIPRVIAAELIVRESTGPKKDNLSKSAYKC